ncbi:MAG: type II toxin-antitoxin system HicA family toxin [Alphaproteobacteria bacterium]
MNSKHRRTLEAIFAEPTSGSIEWRRVEALFLALGADLVESGGSRMTVLLNGCRADFHRPHPGKEALRYRVRAARELLEKAGIKP